MIQTPARKDRSVSSKTTGHSTRSRIGTLGRRVASVAHGLISVSLIAGITYAVTSPKAPVPPRTVLNHTALSSLSYGVPYTASETYGGTNPIDTCTGCDFWGKQDVGTTSPPTTDPDEMVNTGTGDLAENYTLFSIPDPGFNLQFTLSYDAQWTQLYTYDELLLHNAGDATTPGPFGWGWRIESNSNVQPDPNYSGGYLVSLPGGAVEEFYLQSVCPSTGGTSVKTAPDSEYNYCTADRVDAEFGNYDAYGAYQLYEHGGRQVATYNASGQLLYEGNDEDQQAIYYDYDQAPAKAAARRTTAISPPVL
jgi:hypothetical protein